VVPTAIVIVAGTKAEPDICMPTGVGSFTPGAAGVAGTAGVVGGVAGAVGAVGVVGATGVVGDAGAE